MIKEIVEISQETRDLAYRNGYTQAIIHVMEWLLLQDTSPLTIALRKKLDELQEVNHA